jgi:putative ABC transport system permease protein
MIALLVRLAFAGIRTRVAASALTLAIAGSAASTIVLALEVRGTGEDPWQRTFDAANGAHVLAFVPSQADAQKLARRPGVAEYGAPTPLATASLRVASDVDPIQLAGLTTPSSVNRPVITAGTEPGTTGILLERSLADALDIAVGTTVTVAADGRPVELSVLGTAVTPSQPRYPRQTPGLAWVSPSVLERIAPNRSSWRWTEAVRLEHPNAAAAFVRDAASDFPAGALGSGAVSFATWQDQREEALRDAEPTQLILTIFTILLLIVAFAVVGILVGARASDQHREIAVMKAAGLTPRQIGLVFAIESVVLGVGAASLGFGFGVLVAPQLADPTAATMIGSPTIVANPWHLVVACGVVVPLLLWSALSAARRSARSTTRQTMIAFTVAPPSTRLTRAVGRARLPVSVELGLQQLLARARRPMLLGGAITLTGAVVVVALSLSTTLDARPSGEASDVPDELSLLVYTLDAVMLVITTTTVVAVAYLMVRERIREFGVLKAIGLTPRQISSVLVSGHAVLAGLASALSVPVGVGLYLALHQMASGTTDEAVIAPWWSLALVPVAAVLVIVAATSLPAHAATRLPVAAALRNE